MAKRKKLGIALGGGGARGLAHIGVLRALLEAGITPDIITGTSMGAVVGGWYACGHDINELEELFLKIGEKDLLRARDIVMRQDGMLFQDPEIQRSIEKRLEHFSIERCKIPFAAMATDIRNGAEVVLDSGSLALAVTASTSLPVAFKPVKIGERLLIDGVFSNPVPADVARRMGADVVIAVDVSSRWVNFLDQDIKITNIKEIIENSLQAVEYQLAQGHLKDADIVLKPPVTNYSWLAFHETSSIISHGYRETHSSIKEISRLINHSLPESSAFQKFVNFISGTE